MLKQTQHGPAAASLTQLLPGQQPRDRDLAYAPDVGLWTHLNPKLKRVVGPQGLRREGASVSHRQIEKGMAKAAAEGERGNRLRRLHDAVSSWTDQRLGAADGAQRQRAQLPGDHRGTGRMPGSEQRAEPVHHFADGRPAQGGHDEIVE